MHSLILCCIYSLLLIVHSTQTSFFDTICSLFGGNPYTVTIEKDYIIASSGKIVIKNLHGNITIKTGIDKKTVSIACIKQANSNEHLNHMHIIEEESSSNSLVLRTAYDYEKIKGTVEYKITVPETLTVQIITETGDICMHKVDASITAVTKQGNITIEHTTGSIQAEILQQGNITATHIKGPTQLNTNKGTITLQQTMNSVKAITEHGNINASCRQLKEYQVLHLQSSYGTIQLQVANHICSTIEAETSHGTITTRKPIHINASTVILNSDYWERIKRQVTGSVGTECSATTQHPAKIHLYTKKGNIVLI